MKCQSCKNVIETALKYLAYYANGKPVYYKKCDACMRAMYRESIKDYSTAYVVKTYDERKDE